MQRKPDPSSPNLVCLAAVAAAHGVRGALKLRCFTDDPTSVAAYGPLLDETGQKLFAVRVTGAAKGGVIVAAEGISDRDAAERLRGTLLYVRRNCLPEPDADEYYQDDLIGLEVIDTAGRQLGRVTAVHDFGAGDVLAFENEAGQEAMLPFTEQHVPEVDIAGGRVRVAETVLVEGPSEPEPGAAA